MRNTLQIDLMNETIPPQVDQTPNSAVSICCFDPGWQQTTSRMRSLRFCDPASRCSIFKAIYIMAILLSSSVPLSRFRYLYAFLVLSLLVSSLSNGQSTSAKCYYPNGVFASPLQPCNSSSNGSAGSHSACCTFSNGDYCLTSGLCYSPIQRDSGHLV